MKKGDKHTEQARQKIKLARAKQVNLAWGKRPPVTDKYKRKMSAIAFQKNYGKWMIGKKHTEQTKMKMSLGQRLEKNAAWLGGKSFEPYTIDWTNTLRRSIRERDYYTCQECKEPQGDRALSIHHIDYNKANNNPINLISLCLSCHMKTNTNRDYWKDYFTKRQIEAFGAAPLLLGNNNE